MIEPPLVARAREVAAAIGFAKGARPQDGMLLHVLAGRRGVERAAEIGTGAGIGAAWIAAALQPGVPLFTCDPDPACAEAARALFADDPDVHVLDGGWREVLPAHAPFDLLFVDGGDAKDDLDGVLGIVTPGATIVLDDFSGGWSGPDPRRDLWLGDPRIAAVEVGTGDDARTIVAVVRR